MFYIPFFQIFQVDLIRVEFNDDAADSTDEESSEYSDLDEEEEDSDDELDEEDDEDEDEDEEENSESDSEQGLVKKPSKISPENDDDEPVPKAVPIKRTELAASTKKPVVDEYAYDSSDEEVVIAKSQIQITF